MNKAVIGLSLVGALAGPAAFAQLQTSTGMQGMQSNGIQTPYVQGPTAQTPMTQPAPPPTIAPPPPPAIIPPPQTFAQPSAPVGGSIAPLPQAPLTTAPATSR